MPISLVRETDVDVLVIGAGPAGLMCANALAKAGVNVRIVDQRPSKVSAGQADGIQPRTIEVFQSYGLAERLLREGNQMHAAAFYNPGQHGIELTDRVPDVTAPTARYPFELTLHQGSIESIFLDSMKLMGAEVSRPMVPTQLELDPTKLGDPNAYAVRVVLNHLYPLEGAPSTEIVRAKFVVGTDGAHSWVRKRFDIAMEGSQTNYVWGVVDMVPQTDFPDIRNRCAIHSENGSCMIIPREDDKVRLYIQLEGRDAVDATSGRIDKNRIGPHKLLEVASKSMYPYVFRTPDEFDWWTIYIIGQRVASKFSVEDRVFIAGDACHTHSPKAGQGMNASMNDSHNLAWKLIYVLRGWAGLSLLKTYELERRKYAQDLINFDVKFSALFSGKPRTEINQSGVSHEDFLKAFQTFGGFTSGIGIHYGESAIVDCRTQSCARNVVVGQRMPPQALVRAADFRPIELQDLLPSNTLFKLLVFPGDVAALDGLAVGLQIIKEKFGHAVDVISIVSVKRPDFCFMDLPPVLRSHWSKWVFSFVIANWLFTTFACRVLCDEKDLRGTQGGNAYTAFGIDPHAGAVVCVRPDGYVGMVAPLEDVGAIASYFASFLK
ncbi:FAD binding domain-containing protein [Mycena maculata]|uniref:FAD binding domain-containing protein n=1 Tax=Mycena maculata TaxID=230809 RepID=A0AAD7NZW8_9AGAR|nr:FAD binding domain-containing protein [Mycena maculata]